ncbi:MAG: TIGR00730 family Rossman fold protein [Acidimicrobiales bacterium]
MSDAPHASPPDRDAPQREHDEQVAQLRAYVDRVVASATDPEQLGLAITTLRELLDAGDVFSPWRDRPKVTIFGSARIAADDPLYAMAQELGAAMATRGWITVSGAGPGIMEAAARGAGAQNTLGVNIRLPFEQSANPFVDAESRLVEMKYFFTRKVALTKESLAFVFFPGGLGTMDEAFEILTLLHTGKSRPAPVVLVDTPQGDYWRQWHAFLELAVVARGYVEAAAVALVELVSSVPDAINAIERFYANFRSVTIDGSHAEITLRLLDRERVAALAAQFPMFDRDGAMHARDATTLRISFDGRDYVTLRRLIDALNRWVD